jgi:glycolate oxidase FAD binding subunit
MSAVFAPETAVETADVVKCALIDGKTLTVQGVGTKKALGRPAAADAVLGLSQMNGVLFYEPEELVLSVEPGVLLDDIEQMLGEKEQMLAFEPPDYSRLLGSSGSGTIGGAVACGLSGPRRFSAGAARDFVIGVKGVSGRGEVFKSGGRVMKNVTGYDLSKLMTSSFGTLAVLTEITLKVLPKPPFETTLLIPGVDLKTGAALLRLAAQTPFEPSGLAYLTKGVRPGACAAIRLEGAKIAVEDRAASLRKALQAEKVKTLTYDESRALWRDIRDVAALIDGDRPVWRAVIPPAGVETFIQENDPQAYFLDWGGGLVWLTMKEESAVPKASSGAIYLVRAPAAMRATAPVFPSLSAPLRAITEKVKKGFDPAGVLNPMRMYPEF